MIHNRLSVFLFVLTFLTAGILKASHVPGGNISYVCVGPNQFEVTLTLFEDCGTAFETSGPQTINVSNSCGFATPTSLTLTNSIFQQEVSQLCPAQAGNSECGTGTLPGVWMHQWSTIVTLPGPCNSWVFSYTSCCRNTSVNATGQDSYYWETVLNSNTSPCNNSAQITAQPIPYVCANQPVNFNMGAIDPDGDSLYFSLVNAMTTTSGTSIAYAAGYSGAAPIPGVVINSNTGQISFTPTTLGNFIFAVLIQEYDTSGNMVGSVVQDFQFEVINCTNQVPEGPAAGITNFTGDGTLADSISIEACEGDSFCFDLVFTDADAADSLTITSNIQQIFPGATVNISGVNPSTITVCITVAPGAPANSVISFLAEDNACPIPGIIAYPISLDIISSVYAGTDVIMCDGQGVQLQGSGGSDFNWTVFSGEAFTPSNFSCNPCQFPIANPSITTTYILTSNLTGGCNNTDTVTVNIVPDYTYSINQSATSTCLQDSVDISVTTNPALPGYTFTWSPGTNLDTTAGPNVTVVPTTPGTFTYTVTMTSPDGCVKTDSVTISVSPTLVPDATLVAIPDTIYCGDAVQLIASGSGTGVPAQCGASTTGGCAATVPVTIGTSSGQNSSTSWPSPYGNWYANARHQFLFTAAELNAMGFVGGKINGLTWQTTAQNGATASFNGYTIRMGCTTSSALSTTSGWVTGLTTVFGPQNINVTLGNNTHTFSTAYEWDGVSNLVVEICYTWSAQYNYTYNWSTPYSNTGFTSSIYYYSDGTVACSGQNPFGSNTFRPVTQFHTCGSDPNYVYSWPQSPSSANDTISDTPCTLSNPVNGWITYDVIVADANGGCSDTASVNVYVIDCFVPDIVVQNVSCNGASDGSITATMVGISGPWTVNWYDTTGVLLQSTSNVVTSDSLTGISGGVYIIETINSVMCTTETTVTVNEPGPLTITVSNDTTVCAGSTVTLNAGITGGSQPYVYNWSNGGATSSISVTPGATTTYYVFVTDSSGCTTNTDSVTVNVLPIPDITLSGPTNICMGDVATLVVSSTTPGVIYFWNTGSNNDTITASTSGNYIATVSNGGCTISDTIQLVVNNPNVTATSSIPQPMCQGNTTTLTASGTAGNTYLWSTGSTASSISVNTSGTYVVEATLNGCTVSDTVIVTVVPVPDVFITGPTVICAGQISYLVANSTSPNVSFTWSTGSGADSISVSSAGTYYVIASNGTCQNSDTVQLTVTTMPTGNISGLLEFCAGESSILTANFNPSGNYTWNTGDTTQSITVSSTGQYTVFVDNNGCIGTASVNVISHPVPDAQFSFSPEDVLFGTPVLINDNSTIGSPDNIVSWTYTINDSLTSTIPDFTHTFPASGDYVVTLYVVSSFGCIDSTTQVIEVISELEIPNVFSPGVIDGFNDLFEVRNLEFYPNSHLQIFNRWGQIMFEDADYKNNWNGTKQNDGKMVPSGTYFYILILEDGTVYQGTVTVFSEK